MSNFIIAYLIIILYFFIGYLIHDKALTMISENVDLRPLYNQLSNGFKIILFLVFTVFWFPIIIGELFIIFLNWIAKTYNDMN